MNFRPLSKIDATIMYSLLKGEPRKTIAERIGRSRCTVQNRLARLQKRFGASSCLHLVGLMFSAGILVPLPLEE